MSGSFVILGASREQVLLAEACRGEQREVVMLDRFPRPKRLPSWISYRQVDLLDVPKVVQAVVEVGATGVSSGFLEAPIPAVIAARQEIGIQNLPNARAVAATLSKKHMANIAQSLGVPTPKEYGASDDFGAGQLLVKPSDRGGQVGIRLAAHANDVPKAIEFARQSSRTGEVIVQDWVEGTEINVVTFRASSGEFQSVQSTRERLSDELPIATKHVYSSASPSYSAAVDAYARALGEQLVPSGGVLFTQFVVGRFGVWLIDCGVRLPGGLMHLIVLHASGIDLLSAECRWASGQAWDARKSTEPSECVQIQFLTSSPGPIQSGLRVGQLSAKGIVATCVEYILLFSDRSVTRPAINGSDRYVAILAASNDCSQVEADLSEMQSMVLNEVKSWSSERNILAQTD